MRTWAIYSPSMSMFEAIGALLVLGFGSHDVLTGSLQLGDLVGILMLMAFLYDPISRLHQLNQLVQAAARQANVSLRFSTKMPSRAL